MCSKTQQCAHWIKFGVPCCVYHPKLHNIYVNFQHMRLSNTRDIWHYIVFHFILECSSKGVPKTQMERTGENIDVIFVNLILTSVST